VTKVEVTTKKRTSKVKESVRRSKVGTNERRYKMGFEAVSKRVRRASVFFVVQSKDIRNCCRLESFPGLIGYSSIPSYIPLAGEFA